MNILEMKEKIEDKYRDLGTAMATVLLGEDDPEAVFGEIIGSVDYQLSIIYEIRKDDLGLVEGTDAK